MNNDFFANGRDLIFDIQRGLVPNTRLLVAHGHNNVVGTTPVDIWSAQTVYQWLDAAVAMTISSTDAADTAAGAGARTVLVEGLDNNYKEITETVSLNGQTPVTLANQYLRVNRATVLTADASNQAYNLGIIYIGTGTVTAGVPAVVHGRIEIGENRTNTNRITIPAGYTGYVIQHGFSCADNKPLECFIFHRPFGQTFYMRRRFMVLGQNFTFRGYAVLTEKSDLVSRGYVLVGTADVASLTVVAIVKNES